MKFQELKTRINRKLNVIDTKIFYIHSGLKGLHEALGDFKHGFDLFIDFTSESYSDHESELLQGIEKEYKKMQSNYQLELFE